MNQLDSRDRALLADLRGQLEVLEPGEEVLPRLLGTFRESLRAERMVSYGVEVAPEQYVASFCHGVGFPQPQGELLETLNGFLRQQPNPWGYYDPARPAPAQRNRALHFSPHAQVESQAPPLPDAPQEGWRRLGIGPEEEAQVRQRVSTAAGTLYRRLGMEHMFQVRALVCEGPALLAWVGALRSEPFTPREQRLLQELIPSLQRRLSVELRLREAGLLGSALEAALEALGQPAYVLTATGRVVHANSAGKAWAERSPRALADVTRRYARGEQGVTDASVTPLRVPGLSTHYLLVDRSSEAQASARLHVLSERWELTAREAEVMEHIVQGASNKTIAARLGCAERTVEVHVTHVLSKAQVESRSALIAKFFQGP
ncbi:LuxR C-terminal-related transcriptional regulator [Hyalangium rubrum]|uniref:LuxR C-terminal-related transcriptional regulator n=1 Tax=Hyalangium rubrum TaxID=3103134 RepID=A0ABU5HG42_9BACT|nr:LuxR C-terminal-related transcriptional regulator [Hyalangium sp. s54d21]MDY7232331.1 LuxR C-terminal-related transcriptional regulator [Hyalangium sp. s54d21]